MSLILSRPAVIEIAVIIAVLLAAAYVRPGLASAHGPRTLYISPFPNGSEDGSSWSNAGRLENLPEFIAMAGSGGTVVLKADSGPYRVFRRITIRNGGSNEAPVTITGADGNGRPAKAEIIGTRSDPWTIDGDSGSEVFRLADGANYLRFEHISFRNQGNGCFRVSSDIQGLEIQDIDARNVRRFLENNPGGSDKGASINGLVIRRVTVRGYSKGAIRLQSNSSNILIEDVIGDSERQDGDNFAIGVALQDTVHDAVLRRVTMMNSHDSTGTYWNGDGFMTDRGVYNVFFEDTIASGSTDGGYDLKSSSTTMLRPRAENNARNFRIWGTSTISDCVSSNPHKRGGTGKQYHFWVGKGGQARVVGCKIEDSDDDSIGFEVERGGQLVVRNSHIKLNSNARISLIHNGGSLDLIAVQ